MTELDMEIQELRRRTEALEKANGEIFEAYNKVCTEKEYLCRAVENLSKTARMFSLQRDAAIADLDELRCCHSCKFNQMRDGFGRKCVKDDAWHIWNHSCGEWEWRGVQDG